MKLTIVEAKLTHDLESFGKMDPFCALDYRGVKRTTKVKDNASKNPVWRETFEIDVVSLDDEM